MDNSQIPQAPLEPKVPTAVSSLQAPPEVDETQKLFETLTAGLYNKYQLRALMRQSVDWCGRVLLPEECTAAFSPAHQMIWQRLTSAVSSTLGEYLKFAIGLPRGHAKTQLLKFLCVYIITETKRRYILVVCNTASMARSFINDVISILSSNNAANVYGDWTEEVMRDSDELKKFRFNDRTIIMKPMGIGSAVRGTNIDNTRPDVIICDDMQSLEESESVEIADKQLQWFIGTLLLARSYKQCTVIYLGNMYPDREVGEKGSGVYTCILRNLDKDPDWVSIVTGAILADGSALWEEVHPLDQLLKDLAQARRLGKAHIWYAEVQNSPEGAPGFLYDPEKVPPFRHEGSFAIGRCLVIDPSLGKKSSDAQVVVKGEVYDESGPAAVEVRIIQESAPKLVFEVLKWALEDRIPLVVAEAVAYQGTLLQWFQFYADQYGIEGIMFLGINRGGQSKNSAIVSSFKQVMSGAIALHPRVRGLYDNQAQFFNALKTDNADDILDTVEYLERVALRYPNEMAVYLEHEMTHSNIPSTEAVQPTTFNAATYDFRQR